MAQDWRRIELRTALGLVVSAALIRVASSGPNGIIGGRKNKEAHRLPRDIPSEPDREERILMQIVVDAYNEQERAMGWYCHLENEMTFPFTARCREGRSISPLRLKDKVTVVGMADSDECLEEMLVEIEWDEDGLAIPLSQLEVLKADDATRQAVGDWHYWVGRGYQF